MKNKEAIETIKEIRAMMEKSSRYLSFSGTSVILIGLYALAGAFAGLNVMSSVKHIPGEYLTPSWIAIAPKLILIAASVWH